MNTKTGNNSGIQNFGGSIQAENIAVGEGATIQIGTVTRSQAGVAIDEIKAILSASGADTAEAEQAAAIVAEEVAKPEADKSRVMDALGILERIGKVGGQLADVGIKTAPHVAKLAAILL